MGEKIKNKQTLKKHIIGTYKKSLGTFPKVGVIEICHEAFPFSLI